MKLKNKYFNQANFFTRSIFKLDREIHKDIVYLIQSKIDFYGKPQSLIRIHFNDYLTFKNIEKNNTYSFSQFHQFADEIKNVGGAFYNKVNNSFISFNIVDNVQVDTKNSETLIIELARFGKIFFFQENLITYLKDITPTGKPISYIGHTQIESASFKINGLRRKKFYEIISQFKNTGFCKISVLELKMYLGYIDVINKDTDEPIMQEEQLKFIFIPQRSYSFKDNCPRYSHFERDFLVPAIKSINRDNSKDVQNLIFKKTKTGRKISHLEFLFDASGKDLTPEEIECLKLFESLKLEKQQVIYLLRRIGYSEMYNRWIQNVEKRVHNNDGIPKYYEVKTKKEIQNIPGYLYKVMFPELG